MGCASTDESLDNTKNFFLHWHSNDAHQNQMMQLLSNPAKAAGFAKVV